MSEAAPMQHICDGCGASVSPQHVTERIARLELATRFRPLHIHALLLTEAPPPRLGEFFYSTVGDLSVGSAGGKGREAVLRAAGIETANQAITTCLAEFQRRGLYLAHINECPDAISTNIAWLTDRLALRIRSSYRAKNVIALDDTADSVLARIAPEALGGARRNSVSGSIERLRDALRASASV